MAVLFLAACGGNSDKGPLPYIGDHQVNSETGDTIYHHIRDFAFIDQDSQLVTNDTYADGIYVADFFFTSCPTICPKVKQQMLRVYEKYRDDDEVRLLSHTIDPKRDTVGRLREYAEGLGVQDGSGKWRFVTGNKDEIYDIAYDYISTALEDENAPGGFNHSGYILLIDQGGHLRAFADGTNEEEVTRFLEDIDRLLAEMRPATVEG